MSDTPETVQAEVEETQEQAMPKPEIASPSNEQASEPQAQTNASLTEDTVREIVRREFDSNKDSRWNKVEQAYGDLAGIQEALAAVKSGSDPDDIMAAMELRSMRQQIASLQNQLTAAPQPQQTQGKSPADEAFEQAVGLVKQAGLDNDPDILRLMGGKYNSPADFLMAVNTEILGRQTGAKPSAASAAGQTPRGDVGNKELNAEQLSAKWEGLSRRKRTPAIQKEMDDLIEKMDELERATEREPEVLEVLGQSGPISVG